MRTGLALSFFVVMTACMAPTAPDAGEGSVDTTSAVKGKHTNGRPEVGMLWRENHDLRCTATLIDANVVLSTAYCVEGSTDNADGYVFYMQTPFGIASRRADKIHAFTAGQNLSLLHLALPVDPSIAKPANIADASNPVTAAYVKGDGSHEGTVTEMGYGCSGASLKKQYVETDFALYGLHNACDVDGDVGAPIFLGNLDDNGPIALLIATAALDDQYFAPPKIRSEIQAQIDAWAASSTAPTTADGPGASSETWDNAGRLAQGCTSAHEAMSPECATAYSQFCSAAGVKRPGYGPTGKTVDSAGVTCVDGDMMGAHFSDWVSGIPDCDGSPGHVERSTCASAVSRYCMARGYETGFGPIEHFGDDLTLVCLPRTTARRVQTTYSKLQTYLASCDGSTERWGGDCSFAANRLCQKSMGAQSGYGPVENSGDEVTVVCTY
jgi:hypothetical protein